MNNDNQSTTEPAAQKDKESDNNREYRYYLEDHPFLGPVVTLLLGGLCLYSTIFSNLARDILIGSGADSTMVFNFNRATGWIIAFVVGIMFLMLIFLLVNIGDVGIRKIRRRPTVCPSCGLTEVSRSTQFKHVPVKSTDWEVITCPRCEHTWHGRR